MTLAERIVDTVLTDLRGRRDIGDELDQIEHDDQQTAAEIRSSLTGLVQDELDKETT